MKKQLTFVVPKINKRGGQERSSFEVLTRLVRNGWNIRIMSFELEDWPNDLPVEWIRVLNLPIPTQLLRNLWFSLATMFLLSLKREGIVVTIGNASWVSDIRVIQFVHHAYFKLIKKGLAPYPNEKTIFHKCYQWCYLNKYILLEKFLYPRTKHLLAIANTVKKSLEELKEDTPVSVVHHAPDIQGGRPDSENDNESSILKILFVGALERKGIEKALRTLKPLKDQQWQFDVVGDGNINHWESMSREFGLENHVFFHGVKKSIPYFKKADIFLFPSTYEPYGLVVSEAISYGCCPIVSNECGAMELWHSRPSWLNLSASDEDHKWTEAIERLLKDEQTRSEVLDSSFGSFSAHNWDIVANEYEKIFERYLSF